MLADIVGFTRVAAGTSWAPRFTSLSIDNAAFLGGSVSGTGIGDLSTVLSGGGTFTGGFGIVSTGTDHAGTACSKTNSTNFQITGSLVETKTTFAARSYTGVCVSATQGGVSNSPFVQAFTISGVTRGTLKTTVSIINDGASTMAAGTPTQTHGMQFPDGYVCGGAAPVLTDNTNKHIEPYSYGLASHFPNGCLKEVTLMIRPDFSVKPGAIENLTMTASSGSSLCLEGTNTAGGPWPCYGSGNDGADLPLTDVYSQAVAVFMPGNPFLTTASWGANLKGVWVASLANDVNKYAVSKWFDGQAGTGHKISVEAVIRFTANTHGDSTLDNIGFTDPWVVAGTTYPVDTSALTNGQKINCSNDVSNMTITVATSSSVTLSGAATGSHTGISCTIQHGALRYDFYTEELTESSHRFGGFRWLGATRQPKYNNDIVAKNYRVFSAPNYMNPDQGPYWSATGVSGKPLSWKGGDGNPMVGVSFGAICNGDNRDLHSRGDNFYFGAPQEGNPIPVMFTGGSLPSEIDAHSAYWIRTQPRVDALLTHQGPAQANNSRTIALCTGGSGTVAPVPVVEPFTRIFWANDNGRYNFVQGSGTLTSETTLRWKLNQPYLVSTKIWPPYDTSIDGSALVYAWGDAQRVVNVWNPWNIGLLYQYQQATGDHPDLGPLPNSCAKRFWKDDARGDLLVRTEGLANGLQPFDFKDAATDMPPNVLDSGAATYTGLPNGTLSLDASYGPGNLSYDAPPLGDWSAAFSNIDTSHEPAYAPCAYMTTGELQYLDLMLDTATTGLLYNVDHANRRQTTPVAANGIFMGFMSGGEPRQQSWLHRDWAWLAGLIAYDPTGTAPTYSWGGTQLANYVVKIEENNDQFAAAVFDPANNITNAYVEGCATAPAAICSSGSGAGRAMWMEAPNLSTLANAPVGVLSDQYVGEINYGVTAFNIDIGTRQDASAIKWVKYWFTGREYERVNEGGYNVYAFGGGVTGANHIAGNYGTLPTSTTDRNYFSGTHGSGIFAGTFGWRRQASPTSVNYTFTNVAGSGYPALSHYDKITFCGSNTNAVAAICGYLEDGNANGTTSTSQKVIHLTAIANYASNMGLAVWNNTTRTFLGTTSAGAMSGNFDGNGTCTTPPCDIMMDANSLGSVSASDQIEFTAMPPRGFRPYDDLYIRDLTTDNTPNPIYGSFPQHFNLAHCTTFDRQGHCTAVGAALATVDASPQQANLGQPGGFLIKNPPGTGVANAYVGGAIFGLQYRANFHWLRSNLGSRFTLLNNLIADADARFATDNWNPTCGSIFTSNSNCNSATVEPRWSLHY